MLDEKRKVKIKANQFMTHELDQLETGKRRQRQKTVGIFTLEMSNFHSSGPKDPMFVHVQSVGAGKALSI